MVKFSLIEPAIFGIPKKTELNKRKYALEFRRLLQHSGRGGAISKGNLYRGQLKFNQLILCVCLLKNGRPLKV